MAIIKCLLLLILTTAGEETSANSEKSGSSLEKTSRLIMLKKVTRNIASLELLILNFP